MESEQLGPWESIEESLCLLGVADAEQEEFIFQSLLALRGWAGMLWQMESNAEWTVHPAPRGTLVEYLAVRLLLTRLAVRHIADEAGLAADNLHDLRHQTGPGARLGPGNLEPA
jgi:uncharacterized protein YbcC (UPF0753/DUF2309 family)